MTFLKILLLITVFFTSILGDNCPAPPPCSCQGTIIYCDHLNLTDVPKFSRSAESQLWDVELHDNNIRHIQKGAFKNLKLQMLLLFNNQIETMDDGAFDGSENTLLVLHLYNNRLKSIPKSVGKLEQLMGLDIHNNPMSTLSTDILRNVSGTLSSFMFGSKEITAWPANLGLLENLTSISIYDMNISRIPDEAFQMFPGLSLFQMISTNISKIPISLLSRSEMESINLVNNKKLTTESFPENGFGNFPKLMNMNIMNSSIKVLPNIFANLSNLYILQLENNPIVAIPHSVFPKNFSSKFWFLTLKYTNLSRIPLALSNLTSLTRLDFMGSLIEEINDADFKNLRKLERLYFTDNLLHTISDNALNDLVALKFLILDNTCLTTVPKAMMNLPSLLQLSLENSNIVCTCENFKWIRDWKRKTYVEIYGSCKNIRMTIGTYIFQELPKCK